MKTLIASSMLLLSATVAAESSQCNLQLKQDLRITPALVELSERGQSLWQIDAQGNLWLNGKTQQINAEQRELLLQYQAGLRDQTEKTVVLVGDAMKLAVSAVGQAMTELTGKDLAEFDGLQSALQKVELTTDELIVRDGQSIEIRGSQMQQLDEAFGPEFEQAIEDAVQESMGSVLWQMGLAMMSGDGDFEQRMNSFGERMELVGEQIEQSVELKASALEQQGDALCQNLQALNQVETRLQQQLPAFAAYDLLNTEQNGDDAKLVSF
ncbi:DUF2884 family protein [Rheinheimera sp.]|uniref:DUF2884 family protein n=1 Tax=Rheinheimera sp. TaxID=1869214 RepID=UPI00307EF5D9